MSRPIKQRIRREKRFVQPSGNYYGVPTLRRLNRLKLATAKGKQQMNEAIHKSATHRPGKPEKKNSLFVSYPKIIY